MPYLEREAELVRRLCARTNEGTVIWSNTDQEEVYQVQLPGFTIQVFQKWLDDNEETHETCLSVFNQDGVLLESFSDSMLSEPELLGPDAFLFMTDLFNMARRTALGVDQALDDLLALL